MSLQDSAILLLDELTSNRLDVIKVGNRRVAQGRNAQWYQELCAEYTNIRRHGRKPRTIIKRYLVIHTLTQFIEHYKMNTLYFDRILPYLERRIHDWQSDRPAGII